MEEALQSRVFLMSCSNLLPFTIFCWLGKVSNLTVCNKNKGVYEHLDNSDSSQHNMITWWKYSLISCLDEKKT